MAIDAGTDEISDTSGGEHNRLKKLGKYRIDKRIGAGGMGTVFLAVDESLNRTVALKVLPKDRAQSPVLVRRFKAEGQAAAHMEHPNIVRVFEAGETDGFLYMALEYIEGIDVHDLVERRGVIPVKRATDIIRQTALALQHAYEKGIVHRDIKPSNLLIKRDGTVKLADMGLARSVDDTLETNITRAGTTVGTVDYMSPEQARNSKNTDVRSDIYSLGCTWYHMLTGEPPFPEGSMTNKLQAHAVSTRPDPRAKNERIPEAIVAVIHRMMARKAEDRYQSPQELIDDIEASSRMHRSVDESALAALAGDTAAPEGWEEDDEPDLRMSDDASEFDLSSLKDSGEHGAHAPVARSNPIKPGAKKEKQQQKSRHRRSTGIEPEPEKPQSESRHRYKPAKTKGGSAETVPERATRAAERVEPELSDPDVPTSTLNKKRKPEKQKPPKTVRRSRPKRGTVVTSQGEVPALPPKDAGQPVDGSVKKSIDLESLKYIIPALLVVCALGGIGYAIMQIGDDVGMPGGANPYANESPEGDSPPAQVSSTGILDPVPAPGEDPQEAVVAPAEVSEVPFPGAEDVQTASDETPLIPGWVNAFRQPPRAAERSLVVRRRPVGDGDVATINEALKKLPRTGGTIEIDGDGPFLLDAGTIASVARIRLQAGDGRHPVIQFRPADGWQEGPLLRFSKTQLELDGLHLVLVDAGPDGGCLIEVADGNVGIRNCSITVDRSQDDPLTAICVTGTAGRLGVAATGKCLIENVIIRGRGLTAIALDGPETDLVVGNSLLASGSAPAIQVNDSGAGVAIPATDPPRRMVRLLATTVLSSAKAIEFRHQPDNGDVVPTAWIVRRSLFGVDSHAESPTSMMQMRNWPLGAGGLGESGVLGLTCRIDESRFVGWQNLVSIIGADGEPIVQVPASRDDWRRFWSQGLGSEAVVEQPIVSGPPHSVSGESVHAELANFVKPLKGGNLPGCRPDAIPAVPSEMIRHVAAAMRRPVEPEWFGKSMRVKDDVVRFDLGTRRSLPRFIASSDCEDGTHVIAFGSGLKEMEPILIENKSVRLELESTGKTPLLLQPEAAREGAPAEEAFITVRGGTLDFVNARLRIPASQRRKYPKSAVLLEGGSASLRNCQLEGPRLNGDEESALVRWMFGTDSGDEERCVLIEDSFLVGAATLVEGPVSWQSLIARNTVFATEADGLSVQVASAEQLPAGLVLDHCTIAAGGSAIRTDIDPSVNTVGTPLTIFARSVVFAGPIGDQRQSAVVSHSPGAARDGRLVWWANANGYSDRLNGYRIEGNSIPGDFDSDWLDGWGAGHEANPLVGAPDVLFADRIPDLRLIEAGSFTLAESATARSWDPAMNPIGASPESIGPQNRDTAAERNAGTQPSQVPGLRPDRRNPGF